MPHRCIASLVCLASICLTRLCPAAVLGTGELLIGSSGDQRVKRFDPATGAFLGDFVQTGGGPEGMAFDTAGFLYLAVDTTAGGVVERVDPTTGTATMFNQGGNFASPDGLTIGPDGDVFVADGVHGDVRRFDKSTGVFKGVFATAGFDVRGLTFGPGGDLFVANGQNNRVLRFDGATGAFKSNFASGGGLNYAHGLAFGGPAGDLFVASTLNDRVIRYDGTTGAFKSVFAQGGGLDDPTGLVFGPGGDLFVCSYRSDQVLRFDGVTGAFEAVAAQGGGLDGPIYPLFVPEPSGVVFIAGVLLPASTMRRARARG
jgi:DNA-binding beta-propeller fold protein YncE